MTFSKTILSIDCHHVVVLSVTDEPIILRVIMLSAVTPSVVAPQKKF